MGTLYDKLLAYGNSDYYGFHMPGHKRNEDIIGACIPYKIDITEIEGFDNLHHPEGILLEAQKRAAKVYKADETHFLVNGSTAGILSAVFGTLHSGDKVLMARNCHKSVYNAVYLRKLTPVYLYPVFLRDIELNGQTTVESVADSLKQHPDIKAVVITSPTYDGVVSEIEKIAQEVHKYEIPLIVDEAHGAHFGFHPYFPKNANERGADIVIHSLHKTLPALTQSALLHVNGDIADREEIRKYLGIFQTSSPSYVLMAGIDRCISLLLQQGDSLFSVYVELLKRTRTRLDGLNILQLVETQNYDRSKIILSGKKAGWSGRRLYLYLLQKYHLQMEMAAGSYVLAMTSVCDTGEAMDRLVFALQDIEKERLKESEYEIRQCVFGENCKKLKGEFSGFPKLEQVYTSAGIEEAGKQRTSLPLEQCNGYISAEYAYLYPPGVPLLVPGERISEELTAVLKNYMKMGFQIEGLRREGYIEVETDG